jgi:type II secretory pathway pseudopilin PulG
MLVVAIIGLLAAIAIPKFANLVVRAKEAATRGKLGSVRSAISIYYADNGGMSPFLNAAVNTLDDTLVPKYIAEIGTLQIPTVPDHFSGNLLTGIGIDAFTFECLPGVACGYAYDNLNPDSTKLIVACDHTDTRGNAWSLY